MPFEAITKEYEVRDDETIGELQERMKKDLDVQWWYAPALHQNGRTFSEDAKLREAKFDVQKPLVFAIQ